MGLLFVTPLSAPARTALDDYLRQTPRVGDVPLFPAPGAPEQSIRRDVVAKWLLKAEKAAGIPKLNGGIWHPYRRLWANERKTLPDVDVAAAGGWKDTRALKLSYQQADPVSVLKVVEHTA
jgi:integrase